MNHHDFLVKLQQYKENTNYDTFCEDLFPDLPSVNRFDDYLLKKFMLMQNHFFAFYFSLDACRQEKLIAILSTN
jgi:hypothetical protein